MTASHHAWEAEVLDRLKSQREVWLAARDMAALVCLEAVIEHQWAQAEASVPPFWYYTCVHRVVQHATRHALTWGSSSSKVKPR